MATLTTLKYASATASNRKLRKVQTARSARPLKAEGLYAVQMTGITGYNPTLGQDDEFYIFEFPGKCWLLSFNIGTTTANSANTNYEVGAVTSGTAMVAGDVLATGTETADANFSGHYQDVGGKVLSLHDIGITSVAAETFKASFLILVGDMDVDASIF